jgi:lipoprotein-anchoring transpeptidase ErfK/SrfK
MSLVKILAAAAIACAAASAAPLQAQIRVDVDLSERQLVVLDGEDVVRSFPIAIGQEGHETPRGSFEIDRIIWNPDWIPPDSEWAEDLERKEPGEPGNPMQAAKLYFKYPAYYIHGTNQSDSIGEAASHGCIRMYPEDVNTLAEIIQRAGGEGRSEDWFNRMRSSDTNMVEVDLPNPVAIEVHG